MLCVCVRARVSGRGLVWMGTPLYIPYARGGLDPPEQVWARAAHWAAAWQTLGGLQDVHVLARLESTCAAFRERAPSSCACSVRSPLPRELTTRNARMHFKYGDQILYNNFGLAYAQAAGYSVIAFVDIDERPGTFPVANIVREIQDGHRHLALLFMRTSLCRACPDSLRTMWKAEAAGHCANVSGQGLTKPIGSPQHLQWVAVHDAYQRGQRPPARGWEYRDSGHQLATCLLHPVPVMGSDFERHSARSRFWNGEHWVLRPSRMQTSAFESPARLYHWPELEATEFHM